MLITGGSRKRGRLSSRRRGRGQALVEFSLVLPLFLLIVAGIVDFGMALSASITVSNAAREGARLGTVTANTTAIDTRARTVASILDSTRLSVTTTCRTQSGSTWVACSGTGWKTGDSVVVRVDYSYHLIWPLAFGTVVPLSSSVEMRVE